MGPFILLTIGGDKFDKNIWDAIKMELKKFAAAAASLEIQRKHSRLCIFVVQKYFPYYRISLCNVATYLHFCSIEKFVYDSFGFEVMV